jgi:hypothetical protein
VSEDRKLINHLSLWIGLGASIVTVLAYFGVRAVTDQPPGSSNPSAAQIPSPHDQYLAAADTVCGRWFSQINELPKDATFKQIADSQIEIEEIYQKALSEWGGLIPPPGEREDVDAILDAHYAVLREMEGATAYFRATGDWSRIQGLGGPGSAVHEARRLSQRFGLRICTPAGYSSSASAGNASATIDQKSAMADASADRYCVQDTTPLNLRDKPNLVDSAIVDAIPVDACDVIHSGAADNKAIDAENRQWSRVTWRGKHGWVVANRIRPAN